MTADEQKSDHRVSRDADGKLLYRGKLVEGEGPWHHEPDREEFQAHGFTCIVNRAIAWCGYVGVPPGHPWHGKKYDDVTQKDGNYVEVHGGLTYADKCQGPICHIAKPGEPDDLWWLGFDCAHSGDLTIFDIDGVIPDRLRAPIGWHDTYRDLAYVKSETEQLAKQAAEVAS